MRSRRAEILGHVDHAGDGLVRGWAADLRALRSRLALDVLRHGVYLGCARAGALRRDLLDKGIGDGCYGFTFHSPALVASDATEGLQVVAPDMRRTRLTISVRGRAPTEPGHADPHSLDVRSFFGPLLDIIACDADPSTRPCFAPNSMTTKRIDRLFATTHGSPVSAFPAHIAAKYRTKVKNDSFWHWYLETYGLEQVARTPLSSTDIDDLFRAQLVGRSFDRIHRRGAGGTREQVYSWSVHESRRLKVEDCLVESDAIEALRAVPWLARWSAYPLSHFMRLQRQRHPLLKGCAIATARERITFYVVLMLLALRDVHYLGFMPALWLDRMLAGASGSSPFEQAQGPLFDRDAPLLSRDRFCEHVGSMGFDLRSKRFDTFVSEGHRLAMTKRPVAAPPVDVQMIGPFRQSLGLAESCRRIAGALRATGLSLNFVDYRIGARPQTVSSGVGTGPIRAARINILHLNAEEVPEAMVSLPGLLGGAHTIVVPYWELDRPSRAHHLGLDLVDEVWCTTHFLATVFAGLKPVCHIGMSFDDLDAPSPPTTFCEDMPADAFTVLCVADALSWVQRKNLLGAVVAFQSAFAGEAAARLIVKTRNTGGAPPTTEGDAWRAIVARCSDDPRVRIIDADLDACEHKALLASADCLLSLHRAEGLGLDMLDAMQLGTPVVATAYSGNMDFCNAETAWLVDYDLVPVAPGQYAFVEAGQVWAEPRLDSAARALRAVREDAATRGRKTRAASALVRAQASPACLAARLTGLLRARLATVARAG